MRLSFLIAMLLYLLPTEMFAVNTIVTMKYSDGRQVQYLYVNGRCKGLVKEHKVQTIKISKAGKLRQKAFFEQVDNLRDYDICLEFPEVVYDDALVVSGILNSLEPQEAKSMSCFHNDTTTFSWNNINHYYTFMNERVDFVHSITIKVVHHKIVSYEYVSEPEMSDQIVKSYCTFEYDREGRITKRTSVCDGQKEVVVVRYLSSNGFSGRL